MRVLFYEKHGNEILTFVPLVSIYSTFLSSFLFEMRSHNTTPVTETNHLIMTKIKPDHLRIISHKLRSYNVIFSDGFWDEVNVSSMASVFFILSCKFNQRMMICTSQIVFKRNQKYPAWEPKCASILCYLFWHTYVWLLSLLVIGTWVWFHIIYLFTSRWHWNKEAESSSSIFC